MFPLIGILTENRLHRTHAIESQMSRGLIAIGRNVGNLLSACGMADIDEELKEDLAISSEVVFHMTSPLQPSSLLDR